MRKIELKSRKLLRAIFGSISLTTAAFIFQACYGMSKDMSYDVKLTGTVKSLSRNLPVKGIKISVNDDAYNYGITDENGEFGFYTSIFNHNYYGKDSVEYSPDKVKIHFTDIDGIANGSFADTTIIIDPAHKDEVRLNVVLDEKH